MLKQTIAAVAVGAAAVAFAAAPASAGESGPAEDPPQDFVFGEALCGAPWLWNGPFMLPGSVPFYTACDGEGTVSQGASLPLPMP